jgi:hypothetical protein
MSDTAWTIAATITSIAALALAWHEGWATRRHDRLSVRPHIDFRYSLVEETGFVGIRIHNSGLGPAFIRTLRFHIDGQAHHTSAYDPAKLQELGFPQERELAVHQIDGEDALPPGEGLDLVRVLGDSITDDEVRACAVAFHKMSFEVVYESIYRESKSCVWRPSRHPSARGTV